MHATGIKTTHGSNSSSANIASATMTTKMPGSMTTTNERMVQATERAPKAARARALTDPLGAKGFRRSRQRIARETRARRRIVAAAVAFYLACFGLIAAQGIAQSDQPSSQALRAAGLRLSLRLERPVVVSGDMVRIRQVLRNLLDNAIRYTPAGGKIEVVVGQRNGRGLVQVSDTGIGIAPEDQLRVFDRFFRADRARTRSNGGTGLGLAIARAIVLAHGGDMGLESEPGVGTTVWFTLPAAGMGEGGVGSQEPGAGVGN